LTPENDYRTLTFPNASPSCSPPDLPILYEGNYTPFPDHNTVVHHLPYNLPSLGIIINKFFRCIICINCQRVVDCSKLHDHVHKENPYVDFPPDLPRVLEDAYQLKSVSSLEKTIGPIPPIFGIPLHLQPLYFCGCGRGFSTEATLNSHQTRTAERPCPLRGQKGFHRGYGQRLLGYKSFFEVNPRLWLKDFEDQPHYSRVFSRSLPPLRDYSKMEIKGAEDEMNTSSFFYTQRWLSHLEGYTPEDIQEVLLQTTLEAPYGERLREVAEGFLQMENNEIQRHNSFGILNLMGQTTG
jgi:hypothetical protein